MPSKVHAISKPSELIALKYGKNVSKGIAEMELQIERLTAENKDLVCSRRKKLEILIKKGKQP